MHRKSGKLVATCFSERVSRSPNPLTHGCPEGATAEWGILCPKRHAIDSRSNLGRHCLCAKVWNMCGLRLNVYMCAKGGLGPRRYFKTTLTSRMPIFTPGFFPFGSKIHSRAHVCQKLPQGLGKPRNRADMLRRTRVDSETRKPHADPRTIASHWKHNDAIPTSRKFQPHPEAQAEDKSIPRTGKILLRPTRSHKRAATKPRQSAERKQAPRCAHRVSLKT